MSPATVALLVALGAPAPGDPEEFDSIRDAIARLDPELARSVAAIRLRALPMPNHSSERRIWPPSRG